MEGRSGIKERMMYVKLCGYYLYSRVPMTLWKDYMNSVMLALNMPRVEYNIASYRMAGDQDASFLKRWLCTANKRNLQEFFKDLITIAIWKGKYDARWRVVIKHIAEDADITYEEFEWCEIETFYYKAGNNLCKGSSHSQGILSTGAKQWALIGLGAIGGGILCAVTGGIAAPLIGVELGTFASISGVAAALGTTTGAVVAGTIFGVSSTPLIAYKMKKRVGGIEEFSFGVLPSHFPSELPKTSVTIAISGWIEDDLGSCFSDPWKCLNICGEQYFLKYESKYLLEFGRWGNDDGSLVTGLPSALLAVTGSIRKLRFSGVIAAAFMPLAALGLTKVIDNPWNVCSNRTEKVGQQLAEVLCSRSHGHRPITLIGYSFGAKVIYHCLLEMVERDALGIIQDVYLIGAPCTASRDDWSRISNIVAGNITNAYCRSDNVLKFFCRMFSLKLGGIAGLEPIQNYEETIINHDLSAIISHHGDYPKKMELVLREIGVRTSEIENP